MQTRDIIVMGASFGGLAAYTELTRRLPADLPASIFLVQHMTPNHRSLMAEILSRSSPLPAVQPADHDPYRPGHIYTAPSDHHLLIKNEHIRVVQGPRENGFRPSIDALFRSAAAAHTTRVTAVLLTGYRDDGVSGLDAVKRCGGTLIVQDPEEAEAPVLPLNAIRRLPVDHILPLAQIAPKLIELARVPAPSPPKVPEDIMEGVKVSEHKVPHMESMQRYADPTPLTCPDCGGVLWNIRNETVPHLRCVTGHAYSYDSLSTMQTDILENALWAAIRFMEERIKLLNLMAAEARGRNWVRSADQYENTQGELTRSAAVIRDFIVGGGLRAGNAAETETGTA
jgi:two-component system chemotaxis response regulator CheB